MTPYTTTIRFGITLGVKKDDMRKPLGAASPAAQLLSAGSGCHNGL